MRLAFSGALFLFINLEFIRQKLYEKNFFFAQLTKYLMKLLYKISLILK
jgi:hypothetical protein